jgi:hypothetical protein
MAQPVKVQMIRANQRKTREWTHQPPGPPAPFARPHLKKAFFPHTEGGDRYAAIGETKKKG